MKNNPQTPIKWNTRVIKFNQINKNQNTSLFVGNNLQTLINWNTRAIKLNQISTKFKHLTESEQ